MMIYLALVTVATAAILPVPGRSVAAGGHEPRPQPPATPEDAIRPLIAGDLPLADCSPCSGVVGQRPVEVAGVMQSADADDSWDENADDLDEQDLSLAEPAEDDWSLDGLEDEWGLDDLLSPEGFLAKPAQRSSRGEQLADLASGLAGLPYRWGGISPATGFDCSGLVYYVHRQLGVTLNRDAASQFANGRTVSRGELEPGDIVFFAGTYTSGISHDGIYIGGGRFVHAVQPGSGVKITSMGDGYWGPKFAGARRVFD